MKLVINPEALKSKRLARVLSRRQLAELAGISSQRIDMLESGIKPGVLPETAQALAQALSCDPSEITKVVASDEAAS